MRRPSAREKLIESAVEMDDEIMERYLNGDEIKDEEIEACLKGGIWNRRIVPVLVGSAAKMMGVQLLFDNLVKYFPHPLYKGKAEGIDPRTGKAVDRQMSAGEPFSAFVFKTITDPFAGKLTLFKVYSGELHPDSVVLDVKKDEKERIGQIFYLVGKKQKPAGFVSVGDIAAVAKLKEATTGDTLCDEKSPIQYPEVVLPPPLVSFSLYPKSKGTRTSSTRPLRGLSRRTRASAIAGRADQGVHHLRHGPDPYRGAHFPDEEEVRRRRGASGAEGALQRDHKGKDQGAGQIQEAVGGEGPVRRLLARARAPSPRHGFEFVDKIVGGSIPRQYIPSVKRALSRPWSRHPCGLSDDRLQGYRL